jgi:hypothetical protein
MREDRAVGSSMLSALEFDQNPSRAQHAAAGGPVFIMDGGRPSYVLIAIDDYHRLIGRVVSMVDLLSADEHCGIDFEPSQASGDLFRPAMLETQQPSRPGDGSSTE